MERGGKQYPEGFVPDDQAYHWLNAARWGAQRGADTVPESYYDQHSGQIMVLDGHSYRPQTEEEHREKPFSSDP